MGVGNTLIKMLKSGVKKTPKKVYADKGPVNMPMKGKGKLAKGKQELAKRKNEMRHMDKDDSESYKKVTSAGVKKQEERMEKMKQAKKPGMSNGYTLRKKLRKQVVNAKRDLAENGHTKERANKLNSLLDQIEDSYEK